MEKVLLFERPMGCDILGSAEDKFEIWKPVFGLVLPELDYSLHNLSEYVAYLYAAQKWCDLGGDVDFNIWKTKDGTSYGLLDAEIREFTENTIKEQPICADIYEVGFDLSDGIIQTFLVDADLVQRIKEEGQLVDVLKTPYGEEEQDD